MQNRKKGFTLIELIAVLVILAVIALIVTPLILNIVKKVKDSANKRSVDAYGKAVELAVTTYLLDMGDYPTSLDALLVEYSGNEVICNVKNLNEDGSIYLSECKVKGIEVKDSKTDDGWYHYGKRDLTNEEYVNNYGDALIKVVNDYIKINGSKPTDLNSLTLNYTFDKNVTCSIKEINYDGSIYLSECVVDNVEVKDISTDDGWYHYGEKKFKSYNIGDTVTYNGMDFYVISPSNVKSDSVTLLKAEPLTVDEVNTYGSGHVNMYVSEDKSVTYHQTAYDANGYGGMAYYSSPICGYDTDGSYSTLGCTTEYNQSEVKYVVDAWITDKFAINVLTEDSLGYKARLLTTEEMIKNLNYMYDEGAAIPYVVSADTPSWVYNSNYWYWTMSQKENTYVWSILPNGRVNDSVVFYRYNQTVRPVVTLLKSAL